MADAMVENGMAKLSMAELVVKNIRAFYSGKEMILIPELNNS